MAKDSGAVRQRYAIGTGQKYACGGPVKAAPAAPAKPATSYQKYGMGVRKVQK